MAPAKAQRVDADTSDELGMTSFVTAVVSCTLNIRPFSRAPCAKLSATSRAGDCNARTPTFGVGSGGGSRAGAAELRGGEIVRALTIGRPLRDLRTWVYR